MRDDSLAAHSTVIDRLDRATQYAAPSRVDLRRSGILGPRFRGDDDPAWGAAVLNLYDKPFSSRLLIGSALYPSPKVMQEAIRASGAQIVTVSLRRESAGGKTGDAFWSLIRELDVTVLPNTAGCRSVREAVTTAKLARELFGTDWIKLEVIADNDTLQPDVVGLVEAASLLIMDGFEVFPYCTEDLSVATRLVDAGCKMVIP